MDLAALNEARATRIKAKKEAIREQRESGAMSEAEGVATAAKAESAEEKK